MVTLNDLIESAQKTGNVTFEADVLKQAAEAVIEDKKKSAVNQVKNLIQNFQNTLEAHVNLLRNVRKQEKAQSAKVDEVDRAFRFFAATGNPLPMFAAMGQIREGNFFCQGLGIDVPKLDSDAWKVPADWKPAK